MIDRAHDLPLNRQAKVLGISRGRVYYLPRAVPAVDLALMRAIYALHLQYPFAGSRMMQGLLGADGHRAGRLHVATLMKRMGVEALYRRPNTPKPAPGPNIFAYLLRKLPVTRPNQVWAIDITYIPMARASVYLTAVSTGSAVRFWPGGSRSPWTSPSALRPSRRRWPASASRISQRNANGIVATIPTRAQFTSGAFTGLRIGAGIRISMDGKGAGRDNVFVERIWKSVKYEEVYLRAYANVSDARASLGRSLAVYNSQRPRQSLGLQTPDRAYFNALQPIPVAA